MHNHSRERERERQRQKERERERERESMKIWNNGNFGRITKDIRKRVSEGVVAVTNQAEGGGNGGELIRSEAERS